MKPSETLPNAKARFFPVYYNDTVNIMIVSITEVSFKVTLVQSNHHLVSCVKACSTVGTYGPSDIKSNDNKQVLMTTLSEKFKAGKTL